MAWSFSLVMESVVAARAPTSPTVLAASAPLAIAAPGRQRPHRSGRRGGVMSFYRERLAKAIRKARQCCGCGQIINVGQPALDCAGHYEGDFWAATYHPDCRAAEIEINNLHGTSEWMTLDEMESDDWPWLLEEHPIVAARMNITQERYQEAEEHQRRCREAWVKRTSQ